MAWSHLLGGLLLLVGGGAVVVVVDTQPTQRLLLGAVAVPLFLVMVVSAVRKVRHERREGVEPPSREAARLLPFLASGLFFWGWGLLFVTFQTFLPRLTVAEGLAIALPIALLSWQRLVDVWRLRREMRREEKVAASEGP